MNKTLPFQSFLIAAIGDSQFKDFIRCIKIELISLMIKHLIKVSNSP